MLDDGLRVDARVRVARELAHRRRRAGEIVGERILGLHGRRFGGSARGQGHAAHHKFLFREVRNLEVIQHAAGASATRGGGDAKLVTAGREAELIHETEAAALRARERIRLEIEIHQLSLTRKHFSF